MRRCCESPDITMQSYIGDLPSPVTFQLVIVTLTLQEAPHFLSWRTTVHQNGKTNNILSTEIQQIYF